MITIWLHNIFFILAGDEDVSCGRRWWLREWRELLMGGGREPLQGGREETQRERERESALYSFKEGERERRRERVKEWERKRERERVWEREGEREREEKRVT
jgi:hypothetical protein